MRQNAPPPSRLPALLLAALVGFALLIGGGTGGVGGAVTSAPFAAEVAVEESVGDNASVHRRGPRSSRRVLAGSVLKGRPMVLRRLVRAAGAMVRTRLPARSTPLRGPPLRAGA